MRRALVVLVALGVVTCGCRKRSPTGATPVVAPVAASSQPLYSSQPASRPRPKRPPPPPPVTPGSTMTSGDGLVRVVTPTTPGWECLEQLAAAGTPAGGTLMKCRRPRPELFLLVAKDYEVASEAALSPEKVATEALPKYWTRLFRSHSIVRKIPAKHQGATGLEIEFTATHRGRGEIKGIERIFTKGTHVLQLTAEGRRVDFEKYHAAIKPWFEAAAFRELAK